METAQLISKYGDIKKLTCPSGFEVVIREQNGEDDGILSNVSLNKDSIAINTFIQEIVVWADFGNTPDKRLTENQVLNMRLRDKYYILLSSRIFSLGPNLKFEYEWDPTKPAVPYEEDLSRFIWDFSKPLPNPDSKDYPHEAIQAYNEPITTTHTTRTLSTGKEVQFKYMDGHSEKYLIELPEYQLTVNSRLVARDLHLKVEGDWIPVENFSVFKSREMVELRNMMEEVDAQFNGTIDIENPANGEVMTQYLIRLNSFFYPREI